eukprot:12700_1
MSFKICEAKHRRRGSESKHNKRSDSSKGSGGKSRSETEPRKRCNAHKKSATIKLTLKKVPKLRVIFMHGLHSEAQGPKYHALNREFVVASIQMPIKELSSIAMNPYKMMMAAIIVFAVLVFCIFSYFTFRRSLTMLSVATFYLTVATYFGVRFAYRRAVLFAFGPCVRLQSRIIEEFRPDVVVGSSFGGAVAAECVQQGFWSGPTLLLAPACSKVATRLGHSEPSVTARHNRKSENSHKNGDSDHKDRDHSDHSAEDCTSPRLEHEPVTSLVIHGSKDDVIPVRESEKLVKDTLLHGGRCKLHIVDDNHRLQKVVNDGRLNAYVREVYLESKKYVLY